MMHLVQTCMSASTSWIRLPMYRMGQKLEKTKNTSIPSNRWFHGVGVLGFGLYGMCAVMLWYITALQDVSAQTPTTASTSNQTTTTKPIPVASQQPTTQGKPGKPTGVTAQKPTPAKSSAEDAMDLGDPSASSGQSGAKQKKPENSLSPSLFRPNKPKTAKPSANRITKSKSVDELLLPRVDVIGQRPAELDSVPGSADVVDKKTLRSDMPVSAGEALRQVSGVHVNQEDGMGLRINIGIRGLDPVRSRKVLILEDGVPISMAPYGEPEMYYSPRIERMQRLEVVKGSGSILWGPQTIGGVVNFITYDPPKQLELRAEARYGNYGYFFAHASLGDTIGAFGYRLEVIHQRYDGFRKLKLAATDVNGKMVMKISSRSVLGVKLQFYDEFSQATYLGLTTPQFLQDPSQNHAIYDRFPVRRYALAMNHKYLFDQAGMLQTTLFSHYVTRFWQRQDFDRTGSGSLYERIVNGQNQLDRNAPADGSSIFFQPSTGNRNRGFVVSGLESRYMLDYRIGPVENELITGIRFYFEQADEKYIIGESGQSPTGSLRDDETRNTWAMAAYLQHSFMFLDRKLKITPGFRFELMSTHRYISRTRVPLADGTWQIRDTDVRESSIMVAPIPGIGISYEIVPGFNVFAGVHRGFAPPRTKDSITADGDDLQLEPEYSWNYELGLRLRRDNYLQAQLAGFVMDFSNQVIAPSESSGAVAADPQKAGQSVINAGQTLHAGMEASVVFDLPALLHGGFNLPLTVTYTWVPMARFMGGLFDGNRLPYAPEHLLTANLRFFHRIGFSASFSVNFISSQFADKGNTITPTNDGLVGVVDGRVLLNARLGYTFRRGKYSLGAFIAGKNLTNSIYISTRQPQGIQVGEPLQIIGGIHGSL